ncbi:MoaD/ThiS family protein [Candidatus Nitronereus thalassa]|uniref:MoaD/ThiS family protein n=1 Tax=Candidatus Nitronereus thalassa TaxID=3020898 RepID=A0ABU3KCV9_9BACT|nr:MoaD/ThiS family protein [Candidatus Nitronereus thalassa]MDT7044138.1 MoaD/ThiS family protein [Candidatus Nitronereus thalassa]
MKIHLTNPTKELDIQGPMRVKQLLEHLQLTPEAHLVIRGDELVTEDEKLNDGDTIEIRSVISGG